MKAIAKFPAFCGESASPKGYSDVDTCKREIATLFAHMSVQSDGLNKLEVDGSEMFRARGPMGLSGEADYKPFSASFYEGFDRSDEL